MTKVLLVRPDRHDVHLDRRSDNNRLGDMHQPIGLLYLAAMLEKHDISVQICDEIVGDDVFSAIDQCRPNIVGITVTSPMIERAADISMYAKNKGCLMVLGGMHPSALPEESLTVAKADIAVIGEGEYSFTDVCLGKPLSDIKGIAYFLDGQIINNGRSEPIQDVDALPLPARHLIDADRYRNDVEFGFPLKKGELMMRIMAARGCPFACTNCCSHNVFGRGHRARNPVLVVDELETIMKTYGINTFTFLDDDLTLNIANLHKMCELIIERGLRIRWSCYARVGTPKETMKLMLKAGCKLIAYGVESGSVHVIDILNKKINNELVIQTFKQAKAVGLRTKAFFIIGIPGETEADFEQTMELAKQINPDFLWASNFIPLPGSELYNRMTKEEQMNIDWRKHSYFHTSDPVLARRYRTFLVGFYFTFRYFRTFLKLLSVEDLRYYWRMLTVFMRMPS